MSEPTPLPTKKKPKQYVNNADFLDALVEYQEKLKKSKSKKKLEQIKQTKRTKTKAWIGQECSTPP